MIRLHRLRKGFWYKGRFKPVIRGVSVTLPSGKSLALLGGNGAGKSTLLKIISGSLRPDHGHVWSDGAISYPVGLRGSLHRDMTGSQNTRFLARVYGVDSDELADFVQDFAEIGQHFDMPIRTYSSGMKARLTFGISMGIPFDTYLVDEVTAVGDARFKRKSRAVFHDRMQRSSVIMVSHSMSEVRSYCNAAILLHRGQLEYHEDLDTAIERHQALLA